MLCIFCRARNEKRPPPFNICQSAMTTRRSAISSTHQYQTHCRKSTGIWPTKNRYASTLKLDSSGRGILWSQRVGARSAILVLLVTFPSWIRCWPISKRFVTMTKIGWKFFGINVGQSDTKLNQKLIWQILKNFMNRTQSCQLNISFSQIKDKINT